jgi:tRNA threonylcarbamoyl adenosine modification protein (Sua5/YciO/YrdC/YwlC family)
MLKDEVNKALKIVQDGGIILYPTDTIWGIGCDATNTDAVKKIYALKQREESKSMIILLDIDNKLQTYIGEVPDIAYDLIEYAESPLTLVMPGAKNISPALNCRRWQRGCKGNQPPVLPAINSAFTQAFGINIGQYQRATIARILW